MIYNDEELGLKKLNGKELSYNNYNDIYASFDTFINKKIPTTVIIKHDLILAVLLRIIFTYQSFKKSLESDPISAFGGILLVILKLNKSIASEINKTFLK